MGGKSDLANREDRPESGGTDRDGIRSKSGMQERDKEKFAQDQAEKREQGAGKDGPDATTQHEPFSVGSPRNMDPNK
jgi:hypothetical protein